MNTERHPFTPFLPDGCRLLMLGSFPPGEQRWSMRFYYPNFTNDMCVRVPVIMVMWTSRPDIYGTLRKVTV